LKVKDIISRSAWADTQENQLHRKEAQGDTILRRDECFMTRSFQLKGKIVGRMNGFPKKFPKIGFHKESIKPSLWVTLLVYLLIDQRNSSKPKIHLIE